MIDLGKKPEKGIEAAPSTKTDRPYYPSFYVSNIDLGLDEKDVGKVINAVVKIKVNSVSKKINTNDKEGAKKTEEYNFDVMGIDFNKSKPNKDWLTEDIIKYRKENSDEE